MQVLFLLLHLLDLLDPRIVFIEGRTTDIHVIIIGPLDLPHQSSVAPPTKV